MKRILCIAAFAVVSIGLNDLAAPKAHAQDPKPFTLSNGAAQINGGTNNLATPATNTYSSVSFACSEYDNLPFEFSFVVNGNTANAVTNRLRIDIYGKAVSTADNTGPKFSFWITPTVTNTTWSTNLDVRGLTAIGPIVVASTNALTTSYSTNLNLSVRPKQLRIDAK